MAELSIQFARPDGVIYTGTAASLVLVTPTGELGIWPDHAPEVCVLGNGVVRITRTAEDGGDTYRVIVFGGYVEVDHNEVIIIADHARRADDIDAETVRRTRGKAEEARDALDEGDHLRAYYDDKIAWCDLLLKHAEGDRKAA